ncbi:MAG: type II secretion system protein, partial [Pseudomonadales bacterium]
MKTLNLPKASSARQAGFTIIELIVVILLLGILAATALPRFIDVTSRAHAAAFDGVLGGYSTGMALGRAQWTANGGGTGVITGFGNGTALATAGGVIIGTANNALDVGDCKVIFDEILQGGRPPILADIATPATAAGASTVSAAQAATAKGANDWYTYTDV